MARLIRWQIFFAALGILIVGGLLAQLSLTRQTVILPTQGGSYIEGMVGAPQFLNPLLATSDADRAIAGLLFEGLSSLQPDGSVVPALAEGWEVGSEGLVYTCTLRSDIRWHDGEPVTTGDVLFTLDLLLSPEISRSNPLADLWAQVQVEKIDDRRLRFRLEQPSAPFLGYTTLPILPAHKLGETAPADLPMSLFNLTPVGTGPFRLRDIQEEAGSLALNLEANPYYYRRLPYLESLQFRFYADEASLVQALLEGKVDGAFGLSPEALAQLEGQPDLTIHRTYLQAYTLLFLNNNSTILADRRIRRAILYGLDYTALLDGLGEELFPANGPIAPISWAYKPDLPPPTYDPEQAAALLEESGWYDLDGDGTRERDVRPLELTLVTYNLPETRPLLARRIKQQLAPLGIAVRVLVLEDPVAYQERMGGRDFDLLLYGWGQLGRDPDAFSLWHSSQIGPGGWNLSSWADEDADLILERARTTLDQEVRTQLYWLFQERFVEQVPAIPLYYPVYAFVVRSRIRGVELAPLNDIGDRFRSISNWYIKTQKVIIGRSRPAPRYEGGEQP